MLRLVVLSTLLVITAHAFAPQDRLQMFFHFTCQPANQSITEWRHWIELWEYDVFFADENLHTPTRYSYAKVGKDNTLVHFNILSAGDQWFSAGYEPYLHMSHSCTDNGRSVYFTLWPSKLIPIGHLDTSVHVHYDLTNKKGQKDANGNYFYYDSTHITHEHFGSKKQLSSSENDDN